MINCRWDLRRWIATDRPYDRVINFRVPISERRLYRCVITYVAYLYNERKTEKLGYRAHVPTVDRNISGENSARAKITTYARVRNSAALKSHSRKNVDNFRRCLTLERVNRNLHAILTIDKIHGCLRTVSPPS